MNSVWNDTSDIELVSRTFDQWAASVIRKDRAAVEAYHDAGFLTRIGNTLFDKQQHVSVELAVAVREMSIIEIEATRRLGDILLVWSRHFIAADAVPAVPDLGLTGDWGDEAMSAEGFEQLEFSVWRRDGDSLTVLAFEARRKSSKTPAMPEA